MVAMKSDDNRQMGEIKPFMTREKAIELLSDAAYKHVLTLDDDFYNALKLGIQALVMVNSMKKHTVDPNA